MQPHTIAATEIGCCAVASNLRSSSDRSASRSFCALQASCAGVIAVIVGIFTAPVRASAKVQTDQHRHGLIHGSRAPWGDFWGPYGPSDPLAPKCADWNLQLLSRRYRDAGTAGDAATQRDETHSDRHKGRWSASVCAKGGGNITGVSYAIRGAATKTDRSPRQIELESRQRERSAKPAPPTRRSICRCQSARQSRQLATGLQPLRPADRQPVRAHVAQAEPRHDRLPFARARPTAPRRRVRRIRTRPRRRMARRVDR